MSSDTEALPEFSVWRTAYVLALAERAETAEARVAELEGMLAGHPEVMARLDFLKNVKVTSNPIGTPAPEGQT